MLSYRTATSTRKPNGSLVAGGDGHSCPATFANVSIEANQADRPMEAGS
jgi:hypothetical protein